MSLTWARPPDTIHGPGWGEMQPTCDASEVCRRCWDLATSGCMQQSKRPLGVRLPSLFSIHRSELPDADAMAALLLLPVQA